MPLTTTGEGYRTFSEPRFFEAETVAQVRAIFAPVDRSFALEGATGSGALALYKFDSTSVAADNGGTVLQPNNPAFTIGRWLLVMSGNSGGGIGAFLSGHGSPNGAQIGVIQGQTYLNLDDGGLWGFAGTVGTNTGWV